MVGIFDSGIGGLTVVKEFKLKYPNISFIYLGDTARVPYGTRSPEIIKKFAEEDTKFLVSKKVELIVVACNTVSSLALGVVKKTSRVPVFGVIDPAVKKALMVTKNNKIGLVGTRATVNSKAYSEAIIKRHASMLVPLIEEGFIKGEEIDLFINKYFKDFKDQVDTLILGCTHYPIIKKEIGKYLGNSIKLIDPAVEVVDEISNLVKKTKHPKENYYLTDINQRFLETARMFLGEDISNKTEKISFK
ncbi:MAG: glutamate racemase [bacterium]|nr:MAG: glutamate racemase [bacterium]